MTARELKRTLVTNGWIVTQGARHEIATHLNKPGVRIPIPRHKGDIPFGTVQSILKAAGLK